MKPFGGAGTDGNTPDIFRQLPFLAVCHVHELFWERAQFPLAVESSPYWKVVEFLGIPKTESPTCMEVRDLRWICKSAVTQKWYLRALRPNLRMQMHPSPVHSYGFRKNTCASDVNGLVRELMFISRVWALPLITAVQDIRYAFDSMPHDLVGRSLKSQGASALQTGLHLRELTGLQAFIHLPNVGCTRNFDFQKGGKQGGVETPDQWKALLEFLFVPIVKKWNQLGMGFALPEEAEKPGKLFNHAVWADNVILFASSTEMMQQMISDLNGALECHVSLEGSRYLGWKPDSSEFVVSGPSKAERSSLHVVQEGAILQYKAERD